MLRPSSLLSLALLITPLVCAASNLMPDYEVKLLMDPSAVLGTDGKLEPTVLSTFSMPTSVTKMNVQFLDTDSKAIYNAGWSPRIRKTEGESEFELTYKKRYAITNGDVDSSLTQANNDGFDSSDTNYDAQVEWGYQKQTLSISRQKTESDSGSSGMDLPAQSASQKMMINNAPDKFTDWSSKNWGADQLSNSRIYGPILARRSIGSWSGITKFYIEVWPIKAASGSGTEYIVEASFKVKDKSTASSKHDELVSFLQGKGWFLAQDSLKTALIMQRY
ncbi:hypothetical protein FKW77_006250 [Venturia effusa]|uniref:Uncharacterized protein n=1 Tax=Venturia effusa TaxID=50376 RepID=A0A517KWJ4_9PEZI|nr:hypothetical protein FKW77_006250 [Venturia effusa]